MYSADPSFLKDLHRLDPRLGCTYMPTHEHFVITYQRAVGEPVPVLRIENPDGSFRRPDRRDIKALQEGDLHRTPMTDRLKIVAKHMYDVREKHRKDTKDAIRNATKDDKIQLTKAFAKVANTGGKHNSTFRRVNLAPKGQVF
jgi:hypothetical protein